MIAGGTGLGALGASTTRGETVANEARMAEARNKILFDYLDKQDKLARENENVNHNVIGAFGAPNQAKVLGNAQNNRVRDITDNLAPVATNEVTLSPDATSGTTADIAARLRAGFEKATNTAKALAKTNAYGDQWNANNLTTGAGARNIGVTNSFARGNTAILPALQDFAQYQAYKPLSGTGALESSLGSILAAAGGAGLGKAALPVSGMTPAWSSFAAGLPTTPDISFWTGG